MTRRKKVEEPENEPRSEAYVVSGPHRVHEVKPGETVTLDPDKPETARLLARGQIAAAPSQGQSAGVASTDDGATSPETEE